MPSSSPGGLDLLEVEDGRDPLELAGADDPLAVGRDVDAVGRLAAGHEVDEAGDLRGVEHLDPADQLALALGRRLLRGAPIDGRVIYRQHREGLCLDARRADCNVRDSFAKARNTVANRALSLGATHARKD